MELGELSVALVGGDAGLVDEVVEFLGEGVKEERVNDLVDVLRAGVVHAALGASLRVEGGLEDTNEDGGAMEDQSVLKETSSRRVVRFSSVKGGISSSWANKPPLT